eukprot:4817550-Pyramimonas_sp.AAC.1
MISDGQFTPEVESGAPPPPPPPAAGWRPQFPPFVFPMPMQVSAPMTIPIILQPKPTKTINPEASRAQSVPAASRRELSRTPPRQRSEPGSSSLSGRKPIS